MFMEIVWVVITALISFCFLLTYRAGRKRGYRDGAATILVEWKEWMQKIEEEEKND